MAASMPTSGGVLSSTKTSYTGLKPWAHKPTGRSVANIDKSGNAVAGTSGLRGTGATYDRNDMDGVHTSKGAY